MNLIEGEIIDKPLLKELQIMKEDAKKLPKIQSKLDMMEKSFEMINNDMLKSILRDRFRMVFMSKVVGGRFACTMNKSIKYSNFFLRISP